MPHFAPIEPCLDISSWLFGQLLGVYGTSHLYIFRNAMAAIAAKAIDPIVSSIMFFLFA